MLNHDKLKKGARMILEGMGVDLTDSNFKDTPERVAKMYEQLLTPQTNNLKTFPSPTSGMITLRNHAIFALCPHHLLPVELKANVAYIPSKKVLGLSKLARIVESHLTRPIMQEELGEAVANTFEELGCQGVAVVLSGSHGCMKYRGIETTGDVVTTVMRGLFMHSSATREEFYHIVGRP